MPFFNLGGPDHNIRFIHLNMPCQIILNDSPGTGLREGLLYFSGNINIELLQYLRADNAVFIFP